MTRLADPAADAGLSAAMACSLTGAAAADSAPGDPETPPGTRTAAATGTLDEIWSAAGTPDRDGSGMAAAESPARSIPLPPVGW